MVFLIKALYYAAKNLIRKRHRFRKVLVFLLVTTLLYASSQIVADWLRGEEWMRLVLVFSVSWMWLPLTLLFLLLRHGEMFKRRTYAKFFWQLKFRAFDGSIPQYDGQEPLNQYVSVIHFHSRHPLDEWAKIRPTLEIFLKKKIYKITNVEGSFIMCNVFVIEQALPRFIPWQDALMVEGRKFVVGESPMKQVVWDAVNLPHGLVAGSSNSGKTTILRCIIRQAVLKKFNVTVLDFKAGGDFTGIEAEIMKYQDLKEDYGQILVTEPEKAEPMLAALAIEVSGRLAAFKDAGVANIDEYNARGREKFVPWLVVVDEAAEVLDVKPKAKEEKELYAQIDSHLRTLARLSRAAGVHLLMGLIRPDSEVLSGQIKNNLLWRACGYFADASVSKIVLGNDAATTLPPDVKGRFIIDGEETQAYYLPMPDVGNREHDGGASS